MSLLSTVMLATTYWTCENVCSALEYIVDKKTPD